MYNQEVKDFCAMYNLSEGQFYGREEIEGSLDLRSITKLPKGFSPKVDGSLDLSSVTEISEGFNPMVECSLYLNSVKELPEGFSPTVGWSLYLSSITELPNNFSPIISGNLDLRSVTKIPNDFKPIVSGNLHLNSVIEIPNGFNPIVGDCLHLSSLKELPEDFNPTTGWDLYLNSVKKTPEGFNPIVGGIIYYNNTYKYINNDLPILTWEKGKYIKVDGIFCEVLHKRGNIFKCKHITKENPFYIVSDGKKTFSHGKTIKEAQLDLLFKLSKRNVDKYKNLSLDSVLKHDEAVICYRIITGACKFGTNNFLENILGDNTKESYTINEIIKLTENQYGNDAFKDFFNF